MINPVLERRYADCTTLSDAWKSYLDFFTKVVKQGVDITPEMEAAFMETKAQVAMMHDSLMEAISRDANIGQNMMSIVNRSITLRHVRRLGNADQKKIEIEWHECYLLVNETLSALGEERERLAGIKEFDVKMQKFKTGVVAQITGFFRSVWFKLILAILIIGGTVWSGLHFGWSDRFKETPIVGKALTALDKWYDELAGNQ